MPALWARALKFSAITLIAETARDVRHVLLSLLFFSPRAPPPPPPLFKPGSERNGGKSELYIFYTPRCKTCKRGFSFFVIRRLYRSVLSFLAACRFLKTAIASVTSSDRGIRIFRIMILTIMPACSRVPSINVDARTRSLLLSRSGRVTSALVIYALRVAYCVRFLKDVLDPTSARERHMRARHYIVGRCFR